MDEDKPQPMRNYKPAEKIKNGVDKFWDTHQEDYEARAKRSADQVTRVRRHNTAYPKLIDELQKRKSFTRMSTDPKRDKLSNVRVRSKKVKTKEKMRLTSRIKKRTSTRTRCCQCAYVRVMDKKIGVDTSGILTIYSKHDIGSEKRARAQSTEYT